MFTRFADVAFRIPVPGTFTYRLPPGRENEYSVGSLVHAEIHGRVEEGLITAVHPNDAGMETLEIIELVAADPVVSTGQIELAKWMADQYLAGIGECVFKMFPAPTKRAGKDKSKPDVRAPRHELNKAQRAAFESVRRDLDAGRAGMHLLHGVTGSGKTEVYIHTIQEVLSKGRGALLLVPEIALTVQLVRRLEEVFGSDLALLHSGLAALPRYGAYRAVLKGEKRVAVGTRSAIFAPIHNPGVYILDEEHDGSYREHSAPRYDARQIAWYLAKKHSACLILGSATPRLETRHLAEPGGPVVYHRLDLRATGADLPKVEIVEGPAQDIPVGGTVLREIEENLKRGEQAILLLNRRGYHPFLYCKTCEKALSCPSCSVTLTRHRGGVLLCHYCGFQRMDDGRCNVCSSPAKPRGAGTQKLEEYLLSLFPGVRLERLDTDAASRRNVVQECLGRFLAGEIDVLVGTQMIAKGLDAPRVTLVGVLQADHGIALPDFRASERTFALLTQVAGRAGRSDLKGRVYFEAMDPHNEILKLAAAQDYESFYKREIAFRRDARYPPFCRLIRLLYRSEEEGTAETAAQSLLAALSSKKIDGMTILGPSPAPIEKIHNKFRWHILIKAPRIEPVRTALADVLEKLPRTRAHLEIDFDPVDLL